MNYTILLIAVGLIYSCTNPFAPKLDTALGSDGSLISPQKTIEGLIWIEVKDQDGRLGWLPQICMNVVTLTPTKTPRVTATPILVEN